MWAIHVGFRPEFRDPRSCLCNPDGRSCVVKSAEDIRQEDHRVCRDPGRGAIRSAGVLHLVRERGFQRVTVGDGPFHELKHQVAVELDLDCAPGVPRVGNILEEVIDRDPIWTPCDAPPPCPTVDPDDSTSWRRLSPLPDYWPAKPMSLPRFDTAVRCDALMMLRGGPGGCR